MEFVRYHELNTYDGAVIKFGTMKFPVDLDKMPDPRRPGDDSHIVLKQDWAKFERSTGILVGELMKFQVIVKKCVPGQVVYFDVC